MSWSANSLLALGIKILPFHIYIIHKNRVKLRLIFDAGFLVFQNNETKIKKLRNICTNELKTRFFSLSCHCWCGWVHVRCTWNQNSPIIDILTTTQYKLLLFHSIPCRNKKKTSDSITSNNIFQSLMSNSCFFSALSLSWPSSSCISHISSISNYNWNFVVCADNNTMNWTENHYHSILFGEFSLKRILCKENFSTMFSVHLKLRRFLFLNQGFCCDDGNARIPRNHVLENIQKLKQWKSRIQFSIDWIFSCLWTWTIH